MLLKYGCSVFFILTVMLGDVTQAMPANHNAELQAKLTILKTSLGKLKTKLNTLRSALAQLQKGLIAPDERSYKGKSGHKIPIAFDRQDILAAYVNRYNRENPADLIDLKNCQAVGGPFSYYNAVALEHADAAKKLQKGAPRQDMSWGCAWRASLNVLNKVKIWLDQQGIYAQRDKKNREITMDDIQQWMGWKNSLPVAEGSRWIEPADNAELFLCYVKTWYTNDDQIKIHSLLAVRGRLYLVPGTTKESFIGSITGGQDSRSKLNELRSYFKLAQESTAQDVLSKLYQDHYCYANTNIPIEQFAHFDEIKNPFPLNVDDGTLARNIYGLHAKNNIIEHLFIGETHVWGPFKGSSKQSPWQRSGWYKINDIFTTNIMICEIYLKKELAPSAQTLGFLAHLNSRLIKHDDEKNIYQIKVNTQKEHYSCGYHALCNALHLDNLWSSAQNIPPASDLSFFNNKFKTWKVIINNNYWQEVDWASNGDLSPTFYEFIAEHNAEMKKFVTDHKLIYWPFSAQRCNILTDIHPKNIDANFIIPLETFCAQDEAVLTWVLGQAEHYYTLCAAKREGKMYVVICDSLNKNNLLDAEKKTIQSVYDCLVGGKQAFLKMYANRICQWIINKEDLAEDSEVTRLIRTFQRKIVAPQFNISHTNIEEPIRRGLIDKINNGIQSKYSGAIKPVGTYDSLGAPDKYLRALYVVRDYLEKGEKIEPEV